MFQVFKGQYILWRFMNDLLKIHKQPEYSKLCKYMDMCIVRGMDY